MQRTLAFGAGALSFSKLAFGDPPRRNSDSVIVTPRNNHAAHMVESPVLVVTPDIPKLPYSLDGEVKEFHLVAGPAKRELVPGRTIDVWGYNGVSPGPTIEANRGDRLRIIVDNHLPEPTTMHWHGLEIPNQMDGMPYISQKPILPGGRYVYEFTVHQDGTFFYHSHGAMQEMMGMVGLFILHPKLSYQPQVDHDFGIVLQEWALLPNNSVPNTTSMEFNWLTFNGKAGPATTPLVVRLNSRVRLRMVNIGMDHHPIHLHGHTFVVTGTEGGRQSETSWMTGNTVLVGVAQARDVEFVASNPGDWMVHCHLPHHMMNSMMDLLSDRPISTTPLSQKQSEQQMQSMMTDDASIVPGFPQDGLMEMPMDNAAGNSPEFIELPANWSAGMQGMMTLLRVMPEDQYQRYLAAKRDETPPDRSNDPKQHAMGGAR
jgi:FtsP/CotA-like multicopper oxidase with cupredoxin domain